MGGNESCREVVPYISERIEAEIPSKLQYVGPLVSYVVDHLVQFGIIDAASNIGVALHEAITNAIRHGNRMDDSKKVKIEVQLDKDRAVFSVTDEGVGFDPSCVGDPRTEENLLLHDGRGLLLIRHYMDKVTFNARGNQVTMIKESSRTEAT